MAHTLEEARRIAMELSTEDRVALSEELALSVFDSDVLTEWLDESERRYREIASGKVQPLTREEFFRDEE